MLDLRIAEFGVSETLVDAEDLTRLARRLLADGLRRRTADGGDLPVLGWLAALAAHRSDWRPAVAQTCVALAETPTGRAALWQMLAEAPAALLLVDTAERLSADHPGDAAAETLAHLRSQAAQRGRRPLALPLPGRVLLLAADAQVAELVDYLLGHLDRLAPRPGLDGWQTLWLLRDLELIQPWVRAPLAAALLAQLRDGSAEARAAVVEFLAVSGDLAARVPLLQALLADGGAALAEPVEALPSGLSLVDLLDPPARDETLGAVAAALLAMAAAQRPPAALGEAAVRAQSSNG